MKIYGKLIPEFIYHPCAGHDLQQAMQSETVKSGRSSCNNEFHSDLVVLEDDKGQHEQKCNSNEGGC